MPKSEILIELEENYESMTGLIGEQVLNVKTANLFLSRYYNVIRSFEGLVESRDNWKRKYEELKNGK